MKVVSQPPLVVLTYPGHFVQTAVTIKSFFRHNPDVPCVVIVDDLSEHCWPTYVEDCQSFYADFCKALTILKVSALPQAHAKKSTGNGWIRQQFVKLHLDYLIDLPLWFFTDGDVEFKSAVPHDVVPYVIIKPSYEVTERQNFYVSKMLDIDNPGIFTTHPHMNWAPNRRAQVCVSSPPFRTMHAKTLQQLRDYIVDLRGHTIAQSHTWLHDTFRNEIDATLFIESEFELIENFRTHVLKENLNLMYYPVRDSFYGPDNTYQEEYCVTNFVTDHVLGKRWLDQQNISITDEMWTRLQKINK